MRIVVLMSTYNGEKFIREQIDSILAQKGDFQLDLWVRDDGSSDSTQSILQDYAEKGLLRWYSSNNIGPAYSFLDLVNHCTGYDYYAFADQDDFWMPEKISAGINMLENNKSKVSLYFSNAELVDTELKSLGRVVYKKLPRTDFETLICAGGLLGCTMIFNQGLAELIWKNKMPEKIVLHDFYIATVCSAVGGTILYDAVSHMKYRQHGNNVVGVSSGMIQTIKSRLKSITQKSMVSIAEQADTIIKIYSNHIDAEKRKWLIQASNYRRSFSSRIVFACTHKVRYINKNMGFKLRMSILLGNR